MCGYCVEEAYFEFFADTACTDMHDALIRFVHLQESPEWLDLITLHQSESSLLEGLIALCRSWDEEFFRPGKPGLAVLKRVLLPSLWTEMKEQVRPHAPSPDWKWVLEDERLPSLFSIEPAKQVLAYYRRLHLRAAGEPAPNSDGWKERTQWLHDHFVWVYMSLIVADRFDTDTASLVAIAVELPRETPYFSGLDLWIQRRAALACVRRGGTAFIAKHEQDLRNEIAASVKNSLRSDASYLIDVELALGTRGSSRLPA